MSHIRQVLSYMLAASGRADPYAQEADVLGKDWQIRTDWPAVAAAAGLAALVLSAVPALSAPRDAAGPARPAPRPAPALPPSGAQSEPIDLNEGKSAAEMFNSGCAVCHQRPQGLAKGRNPRDLTGFLRQHYTTGVEQAGTIAGYLTSGGLERGTPTPARATPPGGDEPARRPATTTTTTTPPAGSRPGDIAAPESTTAQNRNRRPGPAVETGPDGVIFLPPGATEVPDDAGRRARPAEPAAPAAAPPAAARPRPGSRPTETARPAEPARPAEAESAPPATSAVSPPVEEKPAPPPRDNIPL